jgi:DNA-binding transcriptional regulator YhcF (GntR family)
MQENDPNIANCNNLRNLALRMIQNERHKTFPLVYHLVELALILPVATATVERAFSTMKREGIMRQFSHSFYSLEN